MSENSEREPRRSNKKPKKKKVSFVRLFILITLIGTFIVGGAAFGIIFAIVKSADPVDFSQMGTLLNENSFILDQDGNLIEKIRSDSLRTIVKYDDIPENVRDAFIAIEDQDFMSHRGINPKRIIKALFEDIKAGSAVQGASTITQQLVKNLYLSNEKTAERKIKEAYYAIQMDQELTKEQILEAYLNTAYLGAGAKGVQGAAYAYFSKDIKDLDLAESALIAGITKNPSKYSPLKTLKKEDVDLTIHFILDDDDEIYTIVYDERYKERQQLVLQIMKNENKITQEEYEQALKEDIKTHLKPGLNTDSGISSFFADKVKQDVIESLMKELDKTEEEAIDMLYNQGLRIYSTIDVNMQKIVEEAYRNNKNFPSLVTRKNNSGDIISTSNSILLYKYENLINKSDSLIIPKSNYSYDPYGNLVLHNKKRLKFSPIYENETLKDIRIQLKDAYTQNEKKEYLILKGGNLSIPAQYKNYDNNKNVIISKEFLSTNPNFLTTDSNGNMLISKGHYSISSKSAIQPQSAMVIMDPHTGEIKALVGGRNVTGKKLYNRATNPRQPGSAIKPIGVYAPAIDNGWTAATVVDDVPHYNASGHLWPKNWYSNPSYWGLSTIRQGLKSSMNVMAVKVCEQIGINTSIDYLKKMGITTIVESGRTTDKNTAAVALGGMTKGISPLELTAAYASLANEGVYIKPKSFTKITDSEGTVILENKSNKNIVVSPQVAFIMTDMLKSVVTDGTATKAKLDVSNSSIPVAGKTGTTSNNYDAWFVGYTPYYVGAVWVGNDIQIKLSQGSSVSAKLWKTVMADVHKNLPPKKFVKPSGIISVSVDTVSGKLPTTFSSRDPRGSTVRSEYFIKGTAPTKYDDVHVEVEVDTTTNKLATPFCPATLVEKRVFTKRPIPYSPSKNGGIVPKDYIYEAPSTFCDLHTSFNDNITFPPENDEITDSNNQENEQSQPEENMEEDVIDNN
ncbi:PBP1A family penicillin-binding protein [Lutibacter sp. B2]|nr:PBP1A family penicillin-binding protein [Lutibacter sp. B2]